MKRFLETPTRTNVHTPEAPLASAGARRGCGTSAGAGEQYVNGFVSLHSVLRDYEHVDVFIVFSLLNLFIAFERSAQLLFFLSFKNMCNMYNSDELKHF